MACEKGTGGDAGRFLFSVLGAAPLPTAEGRDLRRGAVQDEM